MNTKGKVSERLLLSLLGILLLVALMPIMSFAAQNTEEAKTAEQNAVQDDQTKAPAQSVGFSNLGAGLAVLSTSQASNELELRTAINQAHNGDIIELTASFALSSAVQINNKTLTISSAALGSYTLTASSARHFVLNDASVNFSQLILDGGRSLGGIDATNSTVVLSGSTIQNCQAILGGAIRAQSGTVVALRNHSSVSASSATYGGGIHASDSSPVTLYDSSSVFGNSTSGGDGGGIRASNSSPVTLYDNSSVSDNSSTGTCGGIFADSSSVTLNNNSKVFDNKAGTNAGGMYVENAPVTLNNDSKIYNNEALGYWGGGISVGPYATLTMNDSSSVTGNKAPVGGGGIEAGYLSSIILNNNSSVLGNIVDNKGASWGGNGGGIYVGYDATLMLKDDSRVAGNTASNDGGGICASYALSANLSGNSEISGNIAGNNGGGFYTDINSTLTIRDSVKFSNNKASTLYLSATWPMLANSVNLTGVSSITPNFQFPLTYPVAAKTNNNILAFNNYDISETTGYQCFNVSFYDDDAITLLKRIAVVETGDAIPPADPSRLGATFDGWSTNYTNVIYDLDVYATYIRSFYTITYIPGTHGTFASQMTPYLRYGDPMPDAPTSTPGDTGWVFDGWTPVREQTVTESAIYTALWKKIDYTLTYHGNNHDGGIEPASVTLPYETDYTIADAGSMVRSGYTFKGWSTDPTGSVTHSVGVTHNITGDIHLYAVWVEDTTGGGGQAVTPTPTTPITPTTPGPTTPDPTTPGPGTPAPGPGTTTPVNNPGATTPASNPDASASSRPIPAEQAQPKAQTGNVVLDVLNGTVPLEDPTSTQNWSLLSLILGVIGIINALLLSLGYALRRNSEKTDDFMTKRSAHNASIAKIITIALGVLVAVSFFVFNDLGQHLAWINQWTILVATIFVLHLMALVIYRIFRAQNYADASTGEVVLEY
jgi:uncharacterized repeat protein (TIGR02543 family)